MSDIEMVGYYRFLLIIFCIKILDLCTERDCPTVITVIPLRNNRLNPHILHTRSTLKHLVIIRVGTIR